MLYTLQAQCYIHIIYYSSALRGCVRLSVPISHFIYCTVFYSPYTKTAKGDGFIQNTYWVLSQSHKYKLEGGSVHRCFQVGFFLEKPDAENSGGNLELPSRLVGISAPLFQGGTAGDVGSEEAN